MDQIAQFTVWLSQFIWAGPFVFAVLGMHVYMTAVLGFPQRFLWLGIRDSFRAGTNKDGMSAFSCLMVNLAASLGVGNIVGVALAIQMGGPGAIFWCWLTGVFGIATKYAESYLAIRHRVKLRDGTFAGGPMYVLTAMKKRLPALVFSFFAAAGGLVMGAFVPANSISNVLKHTPGISIYATGGILAVLTGLVIIGGVKSIGKVCEKLVPAMVLLFVGGCAGLLLINHSFFYESIVVILRGAFTPAAGVGGLFGYGIGRALHHGVVRSIFSNESGMGTGAVTSAAVESGKPERQAMVAATSCFWDTVVMCALTGIAFVSAMLSNPGGFEEMNGLGIALQAFSQIPFIGLPILIVSLVMLAFSSILGWCYIGEKAFEFLAGTGRVILYRIFWVVSVFLGAVAPLSFVWSLSDIFNVFMIVPNLYSVAALRISVKNGLNKLNKT